MAGIPRDLIFVEDLLDLENIINYDALIFPYNANANLADSPAIIDNLYDAVSLYGIGIITSGDWFTNDEHGSVLNSAAPYLTMQRLLGVTILGQDSGASYSVTASAVDNPAMKYAADEVILEYTGVPFTHYGSSGSSATVTTLADIDPGNQNAMIASETSSGSRNIHFGTPGFMADGNLLWSALQWVIYGDDVPVGVKLGRQNSIFVSRNRGNHILNRQFLV